MTQPNALERLTRPEEDRDIERELPPIVCPAGYRTYEGASYAACLCRIEGALISSRTSPRSLKKFCTGDNLICPSWQMGRNLPPRKVA